MKQFNEYIPFGKPNFTEKEIEAVARVMRSGWIGMGNETIQFEKELADYLNVSNVVTVSSCTDALFLSQVLKGIKQGDEVIVPSLTWCSTVNSALFLGAKPVFADINPETLSIDAEQISRKITNKTKAVIVVHYGGLAADIDEIRKAVPDNIEIIEDAAHAFGSKYSNGGYVGTSGNLACFSFYANKNLSTAEGGAIAVKDDSEADQIRSLRQHGMAKSAWNRFQNPKSILYSVISELGYKMNYTDFQAAIGRIQLQRFTELSNRRKEVANIYFRELSQLSGISFQKDILEDSHAKHLFVVLLPVDKMKIDRDDFILELRKMNIGASIHYAPLHKMPLYSGYSSDGLYNTDSVCNSILTLPISSSMSHEEVYFITDSFKLLYRDSLR